MTIVTLTGAAGGIFYSGSLNNSTSQFANPDAAATVFTAAGYQSSSVADAKYAPTVATSTTSGRYCSAAQRYIFDISNYANITNVVATWKGYSTDSDVQEYLAILYYWSGSAWRTWDSTTGINTAFTQNMGNASSFMSGSYIVFGTNQVGTNFPDVNLGVNTYTDYVSLQITYTVEAAKLISGDGLTWLIQ